MDSFDQRLMNCFASAFPDLNEEQIRNASVESVAEWNSLTAVTLVALLQEEFGLQISLADLPGFVSFSAVQNYVRNHHITS